MSASDLQRHLNIFFSLQLGILWDVLVPWMIYCYKKRSQIRLLYIKKISLDCSVNKIHFFTSINGESYPRSYFKSKTKPSIECIMFGVFVTVYYRQQLPSVSLKLKGADLTCVSHFNFKAFPNPFLAFTACTRLLGLLIKFYPTSKAVWENISDHCKGEAINESLTSTRGCQWAMGFRGYESISFQWSRPRLSASLPTWQTPMTSLWPTLWKWSIIFFS